MKPILPACLLLLLVGCDQQLPKSIIETHPAVGATVLFVKPGVLWGLDKPESITEYTVAGWNGRYVKVRDAKGVETWLDADTYYTPQP